MADRDNNLVKGASFFSLQRLSLCFKGALIVGITGELFFHQRWAIYIKGASISRMPLCFSVVSRTTPISNLEGSVDCAATQGREGCSCCVPTRGPCLDVANVLRPRLSLEIPW
jgi:hypothetical protein